MTTRHVDYVPMFMNFRRRLKHDVALQRNTCPVYHRAELQVLRRGARGRVLGMVVVVVVLVLV